MSLDSPERYARLYELKDSLALTVASTRDLPLGSFGPSFSGKNELIGEINFESDDNGLNNPIELDSHSILGRFLDTYPSEYGIASSKQDNDWGFATKYPISFKPTIVPAFVDYFSRLAMEKKEKVMTIVDRKGEKL